MHSLKKSRFFSSEFRVLPFSINEQHSYYRKITEKGASQHPFSIYAIIKSQQNEAKSLKFAAEEVSACPPRRIVLCFETKELIYITTPAFSHPSNGGE